MPAGAYFAHNKKNIFNRLQHVLEMGEKTKTAHRFLKLTVFALAAAIFIPLSLGWRTASLPSMQSSDSQTAHSAFVAYDSAPEPVGGFAALQKEVVYPEIARKAGIEGRVIANVLVSADGSVAEVKILKSLGHNGCDQAAIAAVKAGKWQPARYKSEPVSVWVGIPIIFKLPE